MEKSVEITTRKILLSTQGNCDIIDITAQVQEKLKETELSTGIVSIFIPGATGALTTVEYEPGLIDDLKNLFNKIIPERGGYSHDAGQPGGNAPSHLRASLIGPSIVVPFEERLLQLGTWQQIVFIDFDNRSRKREIILRITGS
jgi:secondary thiamine-phosphate synthase enzyme